jgi:hypothetical protein
MIDRWISVANECPHGYSAHIHRDGWEDGTVPVHMLDRAMRVNCVPGRLDDHCVVHASDTWTRIHGERKTTAYVSAENNDAQDDADDEALAVGGNHQWW